MTHNINAVTGKIKSEYCQVYDSAVMKGMKKTNGVRVPKIPLSKSNQQEENHSLGVEILPQTIEEQKKNIKG